MGVKLRKLSILRISILLILGLVFISACRQDPKKEERDLPAETVEEGARSEIIQGCANTIFPLVPGSEYGYRVNFGSSEANLISSDYLLKITGVNVSKPELQILKIGNGVEIKSSALCENGAIIDFPFMEIQMVLAELNSYLEIDQKQGVYLPSEKDFINSVRENSWETEYAINGSINTEFSGNSIRAILNDDQIIMNWEVLDNNETVQVPAGTFSNALKLHRDVKIEISSLEAVLNNNDYQIATELNISTEVYIAPGIGFIKETLNSAFARIYGIKVPLEVVGDIVLTSFKIGD